MFGFGKNGYRRVLRMVGACIPVAALAFAPPGLCGDAQAMRESAAKSLLRDAMLMPMLKETDRVGPHPADPANQAFAKETERAAARDRAREEERAAALRRLEPK